MDIKDPRYLTLLERARHDWMPLEARWNWHKFVGNSNNDPPRAPPNETDAENSRAIAIDCWKHGRGEDELDSSNVRYLENNEIETWLNEPPPKVDGRLPHATLKLIHKCTDYSNEVPFESSIFATINEVFGLPRVDMSYAARKSGACGTLFTKNLNPVFVCQRPDHDFSITTVISYNPETNATMGFVLSGTQSGIYRSLLNIPEQYAKCDHPLLIPVIMTEQMLEISASAMADLSKTLTLVEKSIDLDISGDDVMKDYYRLSAGILSSECTRFAAFRTVLLTLELRTVFLVEQLDSIETLIPRSRYQSLLKKSKSLRQRLLYAKSSIEHTKIYGGLEMRYEAQKDLLFNLIVQEDSRTNIQLSRDMRQIATKTKKDGSAMKLIAVLGTVFLPSTFVATFFAMPLFNWNALSANEIVGSYFWIYWAVAGPLTFVTMIVVGSWMIIQARSIHDETKSLSATPSSRSNNHDVIFSSNINQDSTERHSLESLRHRSRSFSARMRRLSVGGLKKRNKDVGGTVENMDEEARTYMKFKN